MAIKRYECCSLLIALAISCIWPAKLLAQAAHRSADLGDAHPLRIDDLLAIESIVDVVMSPDGNLAAVTIQRARTLGVETYGRDHADMERMDIWVLSRHGAPQNVTLGARDGSSHWRPVWSPDSRRLAMLSTRGGDNVRLYVWDKDQRILRRISDRGVRLDAMFNEEGPPMAWVGASELLCALLPAGERPFQFAVSPIRRFALNDAWTRTERGAAPSVSVLEGGVEVPEGARPQGQLALFDVRSRMSHTIVEGNVRTVTLSPDARYAAVIVEAGSTVPHPDRPVRRAEDAATESHVHFGMHRRLGVISLRHPREVRWVDGLFDPYFAGASRSWALDGSKFVVMSRATKDEQSSTSPKLVSALANVIGAASNSSLRAQATEEPTSLPAHPGLQLRGWSAKTGFAVFTSEPHDGTLLWTRDNAHTQPAVRLRLNAHLGQVQDDVGTDLLIRYSSPDGKVYRAHVILPAGYDQSRRYPVITEVYPGYTIPEHLPHQGSAKHGSIWGLIDMRLLAVQGYVVLWPSIPGSSGEPIVSIPGFVMPAIDTLIAMGIADSSRLGLYGHSHGAIAAYGLLTLTTRFRAAVAVSGWSDIVHYYGSVDASNVLSDFPHEWATTGMPVFEAHDGPGVGSGLWIGATPWADPDRWLRNNPIYHFDRIGTPLMIVRSDNDFFDMSDGDLAFQALHRLGKRVRYVRYWGEPHTIQSPANLRDLAKRMYAWFEENLRGLSSDAVAR